MQTNGHRSLRNFKAVHIDEQCSGLSGDHDNELFYRCTFDKLDKLTLKHCVLDKSKFVTKGVRDALGLTLTLDCHSFSGVEFSEDLFDLFLLLACKTKGNTEKRKKLLDIVGHERAYELLSQMGELEST